MKSSGKERISSHAPCRWKARVLAPRTDRVSGRFEALHAGVVGGSRPVIAGPHGLKNAVSAFPKVMKRVALGELSRPPRTCGGRLVNGDAVSAAARQSRPKSRGYGGFRQVPAPGRALDFEDPEKGYESNPEGCTRSRFATLSNSRALWFTNRLRLTGGLLLGCLFVLAGDSATAIGDESMAKLTR